MKMSLLIFLACGSAAIAADVSRLCADRAAIERVYYNHRLGDKPAFDQALPRQTLEQLVRLDLRKESVLSQVYDLEVTPAMVEAEVQRINTTTRAPEVLAELKAALENDTARFAQAVARPIVVERELRRRFENDDQLHAPQRRLAKQTRDELLAARREGPDKLVELLKRGHPNEVHETTWQLGARPGTNSAADPGLAQVGQRFGRSAQIVSPAPERGTEAKYYFEDVPPELQNVLRAQLRRAGDVSAVIETPDGFLLYVALEKTDAVLRVAGLTLFKRSYKQWLEEAAKDGRDSEGGTNHEAEGRQELRIGKASGKSGTTSLMQRMGTTNE
jgi:hypothetical protein